MYIANSKYCPVTVLLATYNNDKFLDDAIRSILNQTMRNFELLIIDDASNDNTPEILERYSKADDRIQIIKNKINIGLTKSLNIGLRSAKGKYIARMDGDDISHQERLERQYDYMIRNPNCDFLSTEGILIGESGKKIKKIRANFDCLSQKEYILNYGSPFIHSSMMFSKQKILELGGYDENFETRQDLELWLRVIYFGIKIMVLKKSLVYHRHYPESLSHRNKENLYLNVIIRALYRSKDLGINIKKEQIENLVKDDPEINNYIRRILARGHLKVMIDNLFSGKIIKFIILFPFLVQCLHHALKKPVKLIPVIDILLRNIQKGRYH